MSSAALLFLVAVASFDARWAASLAPNAEVKLPAGKYAGPWKLASGVHITASPGGILRNDSGEGAVLELTGDARIQGLTIEVPSGGFGVRIDSGRTELIGVRLKASKSARAAIFVSKGEIDAHAGSIEGEADYGVLARNAGRVTVSNETIHAQRAAVAVLSSPVVIENCNLIGPFAEAAITLLNVADSKLSRNRITAAKTMGIKVLNSSAILSENRVSGVRADSDGLEGNSLYAQASHLTLNADEFGGATDSSQGPVVMLLHTTARLDDVKIRGGFETLLYVAENSSVTSAGSELRDAPVGMTIESGSSVGDSGFEFVNVTRPVVKIKK